MKKLEITKGEWTIIEKSTKLESTIISKNKRICDVKSYGRDFKSTQDKIICIEPTIKERESNAILIADAGTTYNKCDLLPSELLKQNEALVECLKELLQLHKDGLYSTKRMEQANELLNTLNK